jgi:hypothetical protein
MTYNKLGFAFVKLRTLSFATIDTAYKKTGNVNLSSGLNFGLDMDKYMITCSAKFSFQNSKNQPFLILEVQGLFEIEKNDFKTKVQKEDGSYLISKGLATHFAVLTIGAARGVLHCKTEGTPYNQYLLPTIDVKQMVSDDLIFVFS